MQIDAVALQVCNSPFSKEVEADFRSHQWSCACMVWWSRDPASGTRFPCGRHDESDSTGQVARCLFFDRILNPPSTGLADLAEGLGLPRGQSRVEIAFRERLGPEGQCDLHDRRRGTVRSAEWKRGQDSLLEILRPLILRSNS